ncbi:unnamed protein product [Schistocephalus solidus]|uniref:Uncharacterized protein n=1 Tax=Schistocephalus solidus TaxID=70667 RepID=A0A3P7EXJ0_SCHSO|nr:unnamed protein product [Schistocephalus solidus]
MFLIFKNSLFTPTVSRLLSGFGFVVVPRVDAGAGRCSPPNPLLLLSIASPNQHKPLQYLCVGMPHAQPHNILLGRASPERVHLSGSS